MTAVTVELHSIWLVVQFLQDELRHLDRQNGYTKLNAGNCAVIVLLFQAQIPLHNDPLQ